MFVCAVSFMEFLAIWVMGLKHSTRAGDYSARRRIGEGGICGTLHELAREYQT
jgi:hypothetical protein